MTKCTCLSPSTNKAWKEPPNRKSLITCRGIRVAPKLLRIAANVEMYFGRYGPDWFQELSERQMAGADELSTALFEDMEQDTVYRTQMCLRNIGIDPVPRPSRIKETMNISSGNDIAFLWFLMELFYTSPVNPRKKREYSLNERHLIGAICHLDMITTLRGLNDILPKPINLPKPIKRAATRKTDPCPNNLPKPLFESPYLEPIIKPVIPSSRYLPMPPLPDPNFQPYNQYTDMTLGNEDSRWFGVRKDKQSLSLISKDLILSSFARTDRTVEERESYEKTLFEDFVKATRCYCHTAHKEINQTSASPVQFYCQLEAAKTNEEYIRLVKSIMHQTMVHDVVEELLFMFHHNEFIQVCINCKECKRDYRRLLKIRKQFTNLRLREPPQPILQQFRESIFGIDGPRGLLRKFNILAQKQKTNVIVCVKDIWKLNLYLWSSCPGKTYNNEKIVFQQDADPYNDDLMDDMLSKALYMLKEESLYVIPFMPDAHKLPMLQQWIRVRYGIKYSRKQRCMALNNSTFDWKFLENQRPYNVIVPSESDVCDKKTKLDYGDLDNVLKCINPIRKAYKERLNLALINDGRRFWPTMSPYLCSPKGPPRELFYTYMPCMNNEKILIRPY